MVSHAVYKIRSFRKVAPYTLRIRFNDKTERTIDFLPILAGELYGPLRDLKLFNRARISPDVHTLIWPNGADFDPATLHDWPRQQNAFIAAAHCWRSRHPVRGGNITSGL